MKWIKKGVIFTPDHNYDWMISHASLPVVDEARDGVLRIYFGTRDGSGRSHTSYLEVEAARPDNILYVHDRPILPLGRPGTFDDSGVMPSSIVNHGSKKVLLLYRLESTGHCHVSVGHWPGRERGWRPIF